MKLLINKEWFTRLVRSIWLFPAIVTILLLLFTAFGINGSSTGAYRAIFLGDAAHDRRLLLGEPRSIRSDEWLVNSQLTRAQDSNDYARTNQNIGNGHDMSVAVDAPYKDWSMIFKPHNLAFFVLPFDNAFAFKWWFPGYLLILSCYFFILALAPKKRLWATLLALTLFFNPFIQWWYLAGTMAPIYFSLFAATALIKLFGTKNRTHMLGWGALLAYTTTCFAIVLYPPFQIPCAIVIGAVMAAYTFKKYRELDWHTFFTKILVVGAALLITGVTTFTFMQTRQDVVDTMRHTVYPARRIAFSGMNLAFEKTFSAPLSFALQNERKGASYFTNYYTSQSESATFIKLNFIFVPVILLLIYKHARLRGTVAYYLFMATSAALAVLLLRTFTPFFDKLFQLLLLHQVPNERLEIGFLMLCIIQLGLLGLLLTRAKDELVSRKEALITAAVGFVLFADTSLSMAQKFPLFIVNHNQIIVMVIAVALTIYLLLRKKTYVWGLALFLAINVVSSVGINPLYVGSQSSVVKSLTQHIKTNYPNDGKKWAAFNQLIIENIPQMAGKPSLTGVYSYPQLALWRQLDEKGENEEYNRYAHVVFTINPQTDGGRFLNPGPDTLLVSFDCEMAKKLPDFGYALVPQPITDPSLLACLEESERIGYPNLTLVIYKYHPQP